MMNSTVYRFGAGGKLTPIQTLVECIGQRVTQDHRGKVGVICKAEGGGYTVIFNDGSRADSQTFDSISPFTRIRPVAPLETVGQDEIDRLLALSVQFRNERAAEYKVAATEKAKEVERITAQLRAEYPKAKPGKASLNLKAELKAKFPTTKFSVRGDHSSINIKYIDGPALGEVESIAKQYQDGHFNGMEDIHEYDGSAYGQAFDAVCGRVKYVFTERSYTPDSMQGAADVIATHYTNEKPLKVKVSEYDGHAYIESDMSREHQQRDIRNLLRASDLRF